MSRAVTLANFASGEALTLDETNDRVGIASTTPDATLDIKNTVLIDGDAVIVTATSFVGAVTGNVTGNATGLTGTPSITVQDIVAVGATFSGVLTYEDVTQVDSVGVITARSGVHLGTAGAGGSIFSPASNTVTIGSATTERLRITSAGLLGVGWTAPISKVGVEGTGNASTGSVNLPDSASASSLLLKTQSGSNAAMALGGRDTGGQYIQGLYQAATVSSVRDICINPHGGGVGIGTYAPNFGAAPGADNIVFGTSQIERARITSTGGVSLSNGELIERFASYNSSAAFNGGEVNLDDGMVFYCNQNLSGANTINLTSSVGINTSMEDGDMMSLTLITAVNADTAYINHITVDHSTAPTELWIGGSAPGSGDGGTSNVDIYTFNILKNGSNSYIVIGNHIKTS